MGARGPRGSTNVCEAAAVATVTVAVPEPFGNDEGTKLQVAPLGNPVQDSATPPLNPLAGATVTVALAELPGAMVAGASAVAEIEKSGAGGCTIFNSVTTPAVAGTAVAATSKATSSLFCRH
jgi:hypothetical protein